MARRPVTGRPSKYDPRQALSAVRVARTPSMNTLLCTEVRAEVQTATIRSIRSGKIAPQFSAAIADFVGGAGILVETLPVRERLVYPAIAAAAIALTWSLNVFELLTLASRGFAAYYPVQCAEALIVAWPERSALRLAAFGTGALLSAATLAFGLPTA